jgi:8-oxo-dGTP pyrophosphatase MutT (NUDIX family)
MNKNTTLCNNCGKYGHMFHQCKLPITSYGIILCRKFEFEYQFLMIRRKDSFGYIDFIRGKYASNNIEQIQNKVDEMSIYEKKRIITENFDDLWKLLWGDNPGSQYRNEEVVSSKKFETIKNGVLLDKYLNNQVIQKITLKDIVENSKTNLIETEWEFPKGRRNFQEKDLECALREFEEETGYSRNNIKVIDNLLPFEEVFIGSNHKLYKNKYYLAFMKENIDILDNYQVSEVSKLEWKTVNECMLSIRPYNLEKKKIINNIDKMLQDYILYV